LVNPSIAKEPAMPSGTYRVSDRRPVAFDVALDQWVDAAKPILEGVASQYNGLITYGELAEAVQIRTGIRTNMLMPNWIGRVLGQAANWCHERQSPPLSSVCVHADGTVGPGYAFVIQLYDGVTSNVDLELRAAEDRLLCYRRYAADLPPNGGRTTLTPQVQARWDRGRRFPVQVKAPKRPVAAKVDARACPDCHLMFPLSGRCNNCGQRVRR
jgi:hypothetical protein